LPQTGPEHDYAIADVPTRIFVRPLASGLPLGFFAFGTGMFLLGATGVESIPASDVDTAGLLLAAFVFPPQLLATVVAFLARDTTGATVLGLFASSWLAIGLLFLTAEPGATSRSLGYYLVFFGAVVLLLGVAAVLGKPLIAVVLLLSSSRAVLAAIYEFTGETGWETAGGVMAFVISGLALYGGLAFLLEDSRGEAVLPVFRRGEARTSLEGGLSEQLSRIETEAGVRQQL
jgi:uncharacterized protein